MYGRSSVRQQSACLFIHFLADSSNRSTSCLLSMMLSSRQEITFLCFSHQSFSSLRSVSPLMSASASWHLSARPCAVLHFFSYSNDPSISRCKLLFLPLDEIILQPAGHFYPASFGPGSAHLNSMLQSQCVAGSHCCTCDVQGIFFFCMRQLYFDTSEADLWRKSLAP